MLRRRRIKRNSILVFAQLGKSLNHPRLWLIAIMFLQFPWHSRVGDDWPNSQMTKYMEWRYGILTPEMFISMVWNGILDWMNGQGRFFPMAGFQGQLTLYLFQSDRALAIFYGLFFCITLVLWAKVLDGIFLNRHIGTTFLLLTFAFVRFRPDFEPHIGFAQLVIWSFFWWSLALLFLVRATDSSRAATIYSWTAGFLYFLALCQYELAILGLPVLALFTFISINIRSSFELMKMIKILLPVFLHTLVYLSFVFLYLRPNSNPSGNYVAGFNLFESTKIFLLTVPASVPTIGIDINEFFLLPHSNFAKAFTLFLLVFFVLILNRFFGRRQLIGKKKKQLKLNQSQVNFTPKIKSVAVLAMVPLVIGPSMILSLQPNWWGYFEFGHTYLGVFYSEIGLATAFSILLNKSFSSAEGIK